jgi:hypothetical protein
MAAPWQNASAIVSSINFVLPWTTLTLTLCIR